MEILLVNACVRKKSRTIKLARKLAEKLGGNVTEIFLEKERIKPLYGLPLVDRNIFLASGELWTEEFEYARQFAEADAIIFAAPYWDYSFPAIMKIYLETINVPGVTFEYTDDGHINGLCKATAVYYVMTSGRTIDNMTFGYGYIRELARTFWGIRDTHLVKAENLDYPGGNLDDAIDAAITHYR